MRKPVMMMKNVSDRSTLVQMMLLPAMIVNINNTPLQPTVSAQQWNWFHCWDHLHQERRCWRHCWWSKRSGEIGAVLPNIMLALLFRPGLMTTTNKKLQQTVNNIKVVPESIKVWAWIMLRKCSVLPATNILIIIVTSTHQPTSHHQLSEK